MTVDVKTKAFSCLVQKKELNFLYKKLALGMGDMGNFRSVLTAIYWFWAHLI